MTSAGFLMTGFLILALRKPLCGLCGPVAGAACGKRLVQGLSEHCLGGYMRPENTASRFESGLPL